MTCLIVGNFYLIARPASDFEVLIVEKELDFASPQHFFAKFTV
jgi:hypothetical protein